MKSINPDDRALGKWSLFFALPTAFFIGISVLKFELNINGPYDAVAPLLENLGLRGSIGWNVNLLILLGPVVAAGLALFQVLRIRMQFTENHFLIQVLIRKQWLPLFAAAVSISLLAFLFVYFIRENCL